MSTWPRQHHWQVALGGDGYATGLDDLRQAIATILRTPRGSVPLRPEFGSDVARYLDHPINRARPHLVRETVEAIRRWEPRVSVVRVLVTLAAEAQLRIEVIFRTADGIEASAEVLP
ncbi:MAG: GPW/gp25 family protein [Pseudomonadota bacterium]|jgi:phage baseplate assembly protein W